MSAWVELCAWESAVIGGDVCIDDIAARESGV